MPDEATDTYNDALDLVEVDAAAIYDDVIGSLEQGVGEPLYPGDERRIFGEALVAVLVAYASKANDASRQTLLRYARGQVLDAIGERLGVERIAATPATCTLRFSLSAALDRAITIPAMTRVTTDGTIYFRTDEPLAIASGQTTGTVAASCETAGAAGNGVPAGAIATLVDLQPYVAAVTNTTATSGGDDGEPYTPEGDDRLRERIRLAPNALSTAGPEQAYRYWAMSANADIADVAVFSERYDDVLHVPVVQGRCYVGGDLLEPDVKLLVDGTDAQEAKCGWAYDDGLLTIQLATPMSAQESVTVTVSRRMDGRVRIVPLMEGGEIPDDDVLADVLAAVTDRGVRPMTDLVTVAKPEAVDYAIDLSYSVSSEDEAAVVQAVEGSGGAIDRYIADQCSVMGRDVNPDVLKTYVMDAGAIRCDVSKPTHAPVGDAQVARFGGSRTVSHRVETTARW